jgi:hypothetical protein
MFIIIPAAGEKKRKEKPEKVLIMDFQNGQGTHFFGFSALCLSAIFQSTLLEKSGTNRTYALPISHLIPSHPSRGMAEKG